MIEIDLRTIFFNYVLTDLVCLIVMFFLWYQTRNRFKGLIYLVLNIFFQVLGLTLIFLRGQIPDFISIVISNTLIFTGAVLSFVGLEHFTNRKSNQSINVLLIALFFFCHCYFTYIQPSLDLRGLNITLAYLIISAQSAWLLIRRLPTIFSNLYFHVGLVYLGICIQSFIRIGYFFIATDTSPDYFESTHFDVFVMLSYQILFLILVFFQVLMVNKRLLIEIENQEIKFSTAFHSVPYAIMIANLSNGDIIEVNDGFEQMAGYRTAEVVGKTIGELELWGDIDEKATLINLLNTEGQFKDVECHFRRKNKEIFVGEISAERININNVVCALAVINDISSRKRTENELKESHKLLKKFAKHLQALGEEEKVVIASQIDNELNQSLMSLRIDIGLLKQEVQKSEFNSVAEGLFVKLDRSYKDIGNSLKYSLKLMNNLRNEVLYLMGLVEAVKLYLEEFQREHNINSLFECSVTDLHIDRNRSTTLFKIFQSAMANVAQHSGADEVKVNLGLTNGKLQFEISDNGVGFEQHEGDNEVSKGLTMMKERVLLLDGDLIITSNTNTGTVIKIEVPYLETV